MNGTVSHKSRCCGRIVWSLIIGKPRVQFEIGYYLYVLRLVAQCIEFMWSLSLNRRGEVHSS
jgi:hypothetical protein